MTLSPHYLQDEANGLDPDIQSFLDREYLAKLPNLDRKNPKLLVVFCGGNAVGKSTLANAIAHTFHGLVLENDAMKRCLLTKFPDMDRSDLNATTWKYSMDLYARLDDVTENGLVIRDGVIHWYFDRILPVFEKAGYELFIIQYQLSPEKTIELIKSRGDTPTVKEERFYQLLEDHKIHTERFLQHYTPDVVLTDDTVFDHETVLHAIGSRLQKIA